LHRPIIMRGKRRSLISAAAAACSLNRQNVKKMQTVRTVGYERINADKFLMQALRCP
jgi:hypothetical protein